MRRLLTAIFASVFASLILVLNRKDKEDFQKVLDKEEKDKKLMEDKNVRIGEAFVLRIGQKAHLMGRGISFLFSYLGDSDAVLVVENRLSKEVEPLSFWHHFDGIPFENAEIKTGELTFHLVSVNMIGKTAVFMVSKSS